MTGLISAGDQWNPFNSGPKYGGPVEVVYKVGSYGGEPIVLNAEVGYIDPTNPEKSKYPITDYGCFFGKMEERGQLKHPTPRTLNHPDRFRCGSTLFGA